MFRKEVRPSRGHDSQLSQSKPAKKAPPAANILASPQSPGHEFKIEQYVADLCACIKTLQTLKSVITQFETLSSTLIATTLQPYLLPVHDAADQEQRFTMLGPLLNALQISYTENDTWADILNKVVSCNAEIAAQDPNFESLTLAQLARLSDRVILSKLNGYTLPTVANADDRDPYEAVIFYFLTEVIDLLPTQEKNDLQKLQQFIKSRSTEQADEVPFKNVSAAIFRYFAIDQIFMSFSILFNAAASFLYLHVHDVDKLFRNLRALTTSQPNPSLKEEINVDDPLLRPIGEFQQKYAELRTLFPFIAVTEQNQARGPVAQNGKGVTSQENQIIIGLLVEALRLQQSMMGDVLLSLNYVDREADKCGDFQSCLVDYFELIRELNLNITRLRHSFGFYRKYVDLIHDAKSELEKDLPKTGATANDGMAEAIAESVSGPSLT